MEKVGVEMQVCIRLMKVAGIHYVKRCNDEVPADAIKSLGKI
jgi:hypothetical protein